MGRMWALIESQGRLFPTCGFSGDKFERDGVALFNRRAEELYERWPAPVGIVSDGPYGATLRGSLSGVSAPWPCRRTNWDGAA